MKGWAMATTSEAPLPSKSASAHWVWVVRVSAIVPFLFVVAAVMWTYFRRGQCSEAPAWPAFYSSPLWIPYLYLLWQLRRGPDKRGLRWAVVWGSLVGVLAAIGLFSDGETRRVVLIGLGLIALCHAAMLGAAVKAYRAALAESPSWPTPR